MLSDYKRMKGAIEELKKVNGYLGESLAPTVAKLEQILFGQPVKVGSLESAPVNLAGVDLLEVVATADAFYAKLGG